MRGQEMSEEGDKSREREGDGGRDHKEAHEKSSTKARPGGHVGAFQAKGWGIGSTSGEERIVLLPGQSLRGWDSGVWMVLPAWEALPRAPGQEQPEISKGVMTGALCR